MRKVLIVDDEIIICQMLEKLVDWNKKGMEIIGIAHNGNQAAEMVQTLQPDIIISDVRMPGMDGLQLVEKSRAMGLEIDYIIMSGYKHFEYAYAALNLGVIYYLLKPISKTELEETLDRIIKNRNEKSEEQQAKQELEEIVKQGSERIRKHFLNDIINMYGMQLEEGTLEAEKEFANKYFVSFLTKIDQTVSEESIRGLLDVVDYSIERNMERGTWEYINSYVKSGVVTIVNYQEENREELLQTIKKIMQECRGEMQKFHGFYVVIGVSSEKRALSQVQLSIKEAIEAVQARIKLGTDNIIHYQELDFEWINVDNSLQPENIRVFHKEINSLDQVSFLNHIERTIKEITNSENYAPTSLYEIMEAIRKLCFEQFGENGVSEELLDEFEEKFQVIYDNNLKENMLVYRYKENMRQLFNQVIEEQQNKNQKPIRLAEQYIQEHFNEPITLDKVADEIRLSSAYLSTMFKKEKGINFSEYLIAYRMEQAKIILKETEDAITIVAEKVGYMDAKYFSKTFSKFVGLKPTEYRKLYS